MESTSSIGGSSCRQGPTASGSPYQHTGCGSVWLERVVWDHEAAGSNPVTPRHTFQYLQYFARLVRLIPD